MVYFCAMFFVCIYSGLPWPNGPESRLLNIKALLALGLSLARRTGEKAKFEGPGVLPQDPRFSPTS